VDRGKGEGLKNTMPKILKVEYRESHVVLALDDGEELKLPLNLAGLHGLAADREIDPVQYRDIRDESDLFCCREKALSYLAPRARSVFEMKTYLRKKGFSAPAIESVVGALVDKGYLDDGAYALALIQSKMRKKAMGPALLKKELAARGIARGTIDRAIRESGAAEADPDVVYAAARKKFDSLKGGDERLGRVYRFLLQRGFRHEDAKKALGRIRDESCPDADAE